MPHRLGCQSRVVEQRVSHSQIDNLLADMQLVRKLTSRALVHHARM